MLKPRGGGQVGNVHQRHRTNDPVEGIERRAVETLDIGVDILDPLWSSRFMTTRDRQEVRGEINADHVGAAVGQMSRHPSLATGQVADALPGYLAHEGFNGAKVGIVAHRVGPNPTVIPLGDLVIGTHHSVLPSLCKSAHRFRSLLRSRPVERFCGWRQNRLVTCAPCVCHSARWGMYAIANHALSARCRRARR
jgi:hypothetical protein